LLAVLARDPERLGDHRGIKGTLSGWISPTEAVGVIGVSAKDRSDRDSFRSRQC